MLEQLKILVPYLEWLGILSGLTFCISIFIIPWFIRRLPATYFLHLHETQSHPRPGTKAFIFIILRNFLGLVLLAAGFLMLFIPGQGLLTMLIGLLCMSFPGKQKLILYMVGKESLKKSLNWIRKKMSRPVFLWR